MRKVFIEVPRQPVLRCTARQLHDRREVTGRYSARPVGGLA